HRHNPREARRPPRARRSRRPSGSHLPRHAWLTAGRSPVARFEMLAWHLRVHASVSFYAKITALPATYGSGLTSSVRKPAEAARRRTRACVPDLVSANDSGRLLAASAAT